MVRRTSSVMPPMRHEGIGNALRTAYDDANFALPDDMRQLLSQLDR